MALVEYDSAEVQPEKRAAAESSTAPGLLAYTLFRYWHWVAAGLVIGAGLGLLVGAVKPNSYAAQGKLLFRIGIREAANPEFTVGEAQQRSESATQAVATELQILRSPEILTRVADMIGVDRLLSIPDPRKADDANTPFPLRALHAFQAWWFASPADGGESNGRNREAALSLLSALQPQALMGSSIITVFYEASDPVLVRDVVDAFLVAAEAHHRKVFSSKGQYEFLKQEEMTARVAAKAAAKALDEFDRKNGIINLATQQESLTERLELAERNILEARIEFNRLVRSRAFLIAAIDAKKREPATLLAAERSPEYERLRGQLANFQLRLLDIEPRTGETAAQFGARRTEVEKAMAAVELELEKVGPFPQIPNASREQRLDQLQERLDIAEETLAGLEKRIEGYEQQVTDTHERLKTLADAAPEHDALATDADRRRDFANGLSVSLSRLEKMELLTDQQLGNLMILERALVPLEKAGPKRSRYLLLGAMAGLVFGLLRAFLLAATDSLLRRPSELRALSRREILAVAPQLKEPLDVRKLLAPTERAGSPSNALLGDLWASIEGLDRGQRTIAFLGCAVGVGCSTAALASAAGLARSGSRVLLATNKDFIVSCAGIDVTIRDGIPIETPIPNLKLVCLEGADGSAWASGLGDASAGGTDYVILDLGCPDARPGVMALVAQSDAMVLVAAADMVRKPDVKRWLKLVGRGRSQLLGSVFNRYRSVRPFWIPGEDPELYVN